MTTRTSTNWLPLGAIPPGELLAARLELHAALQIPAALGIARATPSPDYGQHSLAYDARLRALVGPLVPASRPHGAGLRLEDLTLLLVDGEHATVDSLPLAGRTLRDGFAWLAEVSARFAGAERTPLDLPEHELPDHELFRGASFRHDLEAPTRELARWFADLHGVLAEARRAREASPLRVWSHHFDLDTVLTLADERSLGLGFSPGDDSFPEPYLYALPTPAPEASALPALPEPMEWATEGWTGAVLRSSKLGALPAEAQAELAARFYRAAAEALQ